MMIAINQDINQRQVVDNAHAEILQEIKKARKKLLNLLFKIL